MFLRNFYFMRVERYACGLDDEILADEIRVVMAAQAELNVAIFCELFDRLCELGSGLFVGHNDLGIAFCKKYCITDSATQKT